MLEVIHKGKVRWGRISPAAGVAKNDEFLPAALRAAQTCRYLVYSEADFEVFRPAGATRCTDWGEIWHGKVPSSMPNFTPIGATIMVLDPQN